MWWSAVEYPRSSAATWTHGRYDDDDGAGAEAAGEAEVEAEEAVAAAEVDEVGTDVAAAVEGRDDDDD